MRRYELMLILPAEADDNAVEGVTDRIRQSIARSGGDVSQANRWGKRRLSYEIDHRTEGYYLVVEFTAEPGDVKELERVLTLADDVVRFKTMAVPEIRKRAGSRARAGDAVRTEAAIESVPAVEASSEPEAEASSEPEAEASPEPESNDEEPGAADESEPAGVA
jgi:small subunit ribosomal protein S6